MTPNEIRKQIYKWHNRSVSRIASIWIENGYEVSVENVKEEQYPYERVVARQVIVWAKDKFPKQIEDVLELPVSSK
jgi:hypothetical protein